jgi:hypothetical protein
LQIFVLSINPRRSARMLSDKDIIKMIVESSQILSSCHHIYNSRYKNKLYKKIQIIDPYVIWVCKSKSNYLWLVEYLDELYKEYFFRYNKKHKSKEIFKFLKKVPKNLLDIGLTKFPQALPEKYKSKSAITAYRKFYASEKIYSAKWNKRKKPKWIYNKKYICD